MKILVCLLIILVCLLIMIIKVLLQTINTYKRIAANYKKACGIHESNAKKMLQTIDKHEKLYDIKGENP